MDGGSHARPGNRARPTRRQSARGAGCVPRSPRAHPRSHITILHSTPGIDAASSFIQGYWIWSKIIENLAVVDYDPNNLFLAAYDWRLSLSNLEERDGYFSQLKTRIEEMRCVRALQCSGRSAEAYFRCEKDTPW